MSSAYPLLDRAADALIYRTKSAGVTASSFITAAQRLAARLPPGGPVINLCRDRLHFALAFAACLLADRTSLLTSDRSPARLHQIAASIGCGIAMTDEPAGSTAPFATLSFTADFSDAAKPAIPSLPADRLAAIVFTSGTTGEPRAHLKYWGELVMRSRAAAQCFGFTKHSTNLLATVPPQHMYGLETSILLPLHAAVTSCCFPTFFNADVLEALSAISTPRVLITTPLQLRALRTITPPALAAVISATAPLPAALANAIEQSWHTPVLEIYGATEIGSIASRRTTAGETWTTYPTLHLDQTASGITVIAPDAAPTQLDDRLQIEAGNRFRLLGRMADIVKFAGKRASLAGLNHILNDIEGVEDGVFVAPSDDDACDNARLIVYVVAPARSGEDILAALRTRVEPAFLPRRVIKVVNLPRDEVGKIRRADLARL